MNYQILENNFNEHIKRKNEESLNLNNYNKEIKEFLMKNKTK